MPNINMKIHRLLFYAFLIFFIFGCTYDPWEIKSYVCSSTDWIAPHNFNKALNKGEQYKDITIGTIVIKPFLKPTGNDFYGGKPPYYLYLQAYSQKEPSSPIVCKTITYETDKGKKGDLLTENATLILKNNNDVYFHVAELFKPAIDLDFDNGENVEIRIFIETAIGGEVIGKEFKFKFHPIHKKGYSNTIHKSPTRHCTRIVSTVALSTCEFKRSSSINTMHVESKRMVSRFR